MTTQYEYLGKIGEGGFGNVYLVRESSSSSNSTRVIKSVPIKYYSKYIRNELAIMCNLDHPRVIKLIDFFPTTQHFHLVMEYCSGGTLRDLISKFQRLHWKLEKDSLDEMFCDIAFGVQYLHRKKIMHRDLKPENILVTEDYRLKVSDFGVSKVSHDISPLNQTMIGTLCYMSPEVYLHKPYNDSCDIWSLGMILYEMAMMEYAFTCPQKARILNSKLIFVPPQINYKRYDYGKTIQEVLEMMLQRDPKKRYNICSITDHERFEKIAVGLRNEEIGHKKKRSKLA